MCSDILFRLFERYVFRICWDRHCLLKGGPKESCLCRRIATSTHRHRSAQTTGVLWEIWKNTQSCDKSEHVLCRFTGNYYFQTNCNFFILTIYISIVSYFKHALCILYCRRRWSELHSSYILNCFSNIKAFDFLNIWLKTVPGFWKTWSPIN